MSIPTTQHKSEKGIFFGIEIKEEKESFLGI